MFEDSNFFIKPFNTFTGRAKKNTFFRNYLILLFLDPILKISKLGQKRGKIVVLRGLNYGVFTIISKKGIFRGFFLFSEN